jgi:urease accessory protein UreF
MCNTRIKAVSEGPDQVLWMVMQLTDSSLPMGSLSHSQGLESALFYEFIQNECQSKSLGRFLYLSLEQARHGMIPFLRTAWSTAEKYSNRSLVQLAQQYHTLDEYCHAYLVNDVARRASINQGKGFHRVLVNAFPKFENLFTLISAHFPSPINFHYAPLFGLACFLLEIPMEIMERMYMRIILRDLVSASARLNIIGPMEGLRLQQEYIPHIDNLLNSKTAFLRDDFILKIIPFYNQEIPSQSCMMIDFLQSLHDLLYSRLFNS